MARDDGEEALEALAAALDDLVGEPVREDFSGQRWDVHPCRFTLENVAEGFKVGVASSDGGVLGDEGGNVCLKINYIMSFGLKKSREVGRTRTWIS